VVVTWWDINQHVIIMKRIYFLLVFFGALLFCACEKENTNLLLEDQAQFEEGALKGAKKHAVPFKARFENYELEDEEPPPPDPDADLRVYVYGNGNATHLGKTALWQDQKWIFGPVNVGWGTMILIAANGDELWAEFTNSHGFDTFPLFIITGEGEFKGGTGRFENATGNFVLEEDWHLFNAVGGTIITGEILY